MTYNKIHVHALNITTTTIIQLECEIICNNNLCHQLLLHCNILYNVPNIIKGSCDNGLLTSSTVIIIFCLTTIMAVKVVDDYTYNNITPLSSVPRYRYHAIPLLSQP